MKKSKVRAGEIWSVNDPFGRGHPSIITKNKGNYIEHISITHSPKTRKMKNVKLNKNPDPKDERTAFILPKIARTSKSKLGKRKDNMKIVDKKDKSIIRHIKSKNKKKK